MTNRVDIKRTAQMLLGRNDILLLCHKNPDGDTLGSAAALCHGLKSLGKRCVVCCHNTIPEKYDHLRIPVYDGSFPVQYVVSVDVAGENLLGDSLTCYAGKVDLCIDHHASNSRYAQNLCLCSDRPAAAQIIYELLKEMQVEITPFIANCIYTGLITDTGCFRYSSTTPETLETGARLMRLGADHKGLVEKFFMSKSRKSVRLEQYALNNLEYYFDGKFAFLPLTSQALESIQPLPTDIDGLSSMARDFEGVQVSVLAKQTGENKYKISVRTGEEADACRIASAFGGGGHLRAAGCEICGDMEYVRQSILKEVERSLCR